MTTTARRTPPARTGVDTPVLDRLSTLDRFLPVWIVAAMFLGLGLGRFLPGLDETLDGVKVDTVSLPIAVGLLLMMYPVLAKVRYSKLGEVTDDRRLLGLSLVLNWLVGPALMFALAWLLLPDLPEYRTRLIIVGLARCIAMVLIWNDLAGGNREAAVLLVAVNSIFQIVAYSLLGYFYLELLPSWLGLDQQAIDVSVWEIARAVLIFLGVPLAAGSLTRVVGERRKGADWYEQRFLPRVGPVALYALLFTVVLLFALQGEAITSEQFHVARIALPLLAYFALMWTSAFALGLRAGLPYDRNVTVAFTAAGNNFELAIAVAIGVFGVTSGQALAGVVGPLVEVPVLVGLVYVALWARRRFYGSAMVPSRGAATMSEVPEILVVCTHNAGRSVAARVLLDHYGGGRVVVRSAGSAPGDEINPAVAQILAERGLDVSREFPKALTDEDARDADVIITMGCGDACPVYPGKRHLEWELVDPAGRPVEEVRRIVDEIDRRAREVLAELLEEPTVP